MRGCQRWKRVPASKKCVTFHLVQVGRNKHQDRRNRREGTPLLPTHFLGRRSSKVGHWLVHRPWCHFRLWGRSNGAEANFYLMPPRFFQSYQIILLPQERHRLYHVRPNFQFAPIPISLPSDTKILFLEFSTHHSVQDPTQQPADPAKVPLCNVGLDINDLSILSWTRAASLPSCLLASAYLGPPPLHCGPIYVAFCQLHNQNDPVAQPWPWLSVPVQLSIPSCHHF